MYAFDVFCIFVRCYSYRYKSALERNEINNEIIKIETEIQCNVLK